MNTEPKKSKRFNYKLGMIILTSGALIILAQPKVMCGPKNPNRSEAISNSKQIGLALFEFDDTYGSYPNDSTKALVTTKHPDHSYNFSGKSSNAAFLQFMADEIVSSEEIFYAKIKGSKKPDGIITPGEALKKGEVAFSYISGLTSKDHPTTPLVLTPLIPGNTKFDPKPFKGRAIILHVDQTVSVYKIHEDGRVYSKGLDILSPKYPAWNGKAPDIRYPE